MDRDLHRAVTYWTGVWEPGREAISKQVQSMRQELSPNAWVVSVAGQSSALHPSERVVRLNNRHFWACWPLASVVEPLGDITHIVGAIDAWLFLRVLGRRPTIFTVAIPGSPLELSMYDRVAAFAVESDELGESLGRAGVTPDRIRVIYPGVDLDTFRPLQLPHAEDRPFRLLFASTPANADEIGIRGIPLLIELARRCPDIEVLALWRQWGEMDAAAKLLEELSPPPNFVVVGKDSTNMAEEFLRADATVCCFASGAMKSCPNSVIEGFACGRPTLMTTTCGISTLVRTWDAGVVVDRTVEALAEGVNRLRDRVDAHARAARALAEAHFDIRVQHQRYRELYAQVLELAPLRHSAKRRWAT